MSRLPTEVVGNGSFLGGAQDPTCPLGEACALSQNGYGLALDVEADSLALENVVTYLTNNTDEFQLVRKKDRSPGHSKDYKRVMYSATSPSRCGFAEAATLFQRLNPEVLASSDAIFDATHTVFVRAGAAFFAGLSAKLGGAPCLLLDRRSGLATLPVSMSTLELQVLFSQINNELDILVRCQVEATKFVLADGRLGDTRELCLAPRAASSFGLTAGDVSSAQLLDMRVSGLDPDWDADTIGRGINVAFVAAGAPEIPISQVKRLINKSGERTGTFVKVTPEQGRLARASFRFGFHLRYGDASAPRSATLFFDESEVQAAIRAPLAQQTLEEAQISQLQLKFSQLASSIGGVPGSGSSAATSSGPATGSPNDATHGGAPGVVAGSSAGEPDPPGNVHSPAYFHGMQQACGAALSANVDVNSIVSALPSTILTLFASKNFISDRARRWVWLSGRSLAGFVFTSARVVAAANGAWAFWCVTLGLLDVMFTSLPSFPASWFGLRFMLRGVALGGPVVSILSPGTRRFVTCSSIPSLRFSRIATVSFLTRACSGRTVLWPGRS